jgi:hypothetical protein
MTTIAALLIGAAPAQARVQDAVETPPPAAPPAQERPSERAVDPSQPDFTLIALPTNLRIPRFGSAFRVTHRFMRPLGDGNFGDLAGDGFGIDGSAQVGLEFRFGIVSGTQVGIHRTSERTIELFGQHQLLRQGQRVPVTVDIVGTFEGTDNLRGIYSPAIGAVVSRTLGRRGAVYAQPIYVHNSNLLQSEAVDDNSSFLIGFGARIRVRPTLYVLGEAAPRIGYDPDATYMSFAVEKRWGGHSFQVNVSNGFGTTLGQLARGGVDTDTWYLGFNISRKFF